MENPLAVSACSGFVLRAVCLPCHSLPAMPTALIICPRSVALPRSIQVLLRLPLFISMCARIVVLGPAVCKLRDCPVGSCNTGLQWRPVRRVHFDFFFLQSP